MKKIIFIITVLISCLINAQDDALEKERKKANNKVYEANEKLLSNEFINAEATYREAISTNPDNTAAKYNLGNAYYNKKSMAEAFDRFKEASEVANTKAQKHRAFHNMGNVFMQEKQYDKAVEAYKQALRNNPTDDETRYNLALAKKMLEKQEQEKDKDDKNKDQDQKDKDKDQKDDQKEGGDKEKEDKDGEQKDKDKEGDKEGDKEKKPEDNKEGDKEENKKDKKDENKGGDQPKDEKNKPKPRPGQLSPQQVKNLLQAMNNEEKKVQEKINAQKVKGVKVKTEKDW
jgi:tetratricopeptide (TPR) repeat protein